MPKSKVTIAKFMTQSPHSIGATQTLDKATKLMREHRVRHLPVLRGGKLVGMVTDRDIKLIETFRDIDPTEVPVEDAMSEAPYCVAADTPLHEVCSTMAERKLGSAVIMDGIHVTGIFTTVDACRALSQVLI